jgi:hypothetical protein
MPSPVFNFLRNQNTVSIVVLSFSPIVNNFSTFSPMLVIFCLCFFHFNSSHPNEACGLGLHFPNDE